MTDQNPKADQQEPAQTESQNSNPPPPERPLGKPSGASTRQWFGADRSFWLITALLFSLFLFGHSLGRTPRFEIPMMQLVKLIEKGVPPAVADPLSDSLSDSPAPSVTVVEGEGKNRRESLCSRLDDLCIAPNEVTGTVWRQTVGKKSNENDAGERVSFFSGRQGLNFDNNDLFRRLEAAGFENVRAKGAPSFMETYGPTLATTALVIALLFYFIRKMGAGAMAFGRHREILVSPEDIDVSFADVAGVDEAVEELQEIVDFLKRPEKFRALGGRIPKGVLLVGPPGTGKTLLAKAVAGEAKVPFYSLSGSDFVELYAGVGAARVRDLFQQAQKAAPCIDFIDELDALGRARSAASMGGAHDEREQTLNALLVEMDGFGTNSGTIVMAATNRPEILDSALLRSGRFDRQILVDRPDIRGREEILKIHSRSVKLDETIDLHRIASLTSGFVGADLGALVNEAALLAARTDQSSVTMAELTEAIERVTAGLQKKRRVITESEKRRVSYHECGHALAAGTLPGADPVHKISIIPRGLAALGYTLQRPDDERYLMTHSELETRIQILLAGIAAEELVFQDVSTGAQNDLERASEIARSMVMNFGMSRLGRVNFRESVRTDWLNDYGAVGGREYSEQTASRIDEEVRSIIDTLYQSTLERLAERRDLLERLAERLLEKEVLDAEEIGEIIENV